MGYEFGDDTNNSREEFLSNQRAQRSSNLVTDDLKNHYQFSDAIILSFRDIALERQNDGIKSDEEFAKDEFKDDTNTKHYIIWLLREKREIFATHKSDHSFWSKVGFPVPGDKVRIKHKKDLFGAEITEVLSASLADAMAKYGTVTKKAG